MKYLGRKKKKSIKKNIVVGRRAAVAVGGFIHFSRPALILHNTSLTHIKSRKFLSFQIQIVPSLCDELEQSEPPKPDKMRNILAHTKMFWAVTVIFVFKVLSVFNIYKKKKILLHPAATF